MGAYVTWVDRRFTAAQPPVRRAWLTLKRWGLSNAAVGRSVASRMGLGRPKRAVMAKLQRVKRKLTSMRPQRDAPAQPAVGVNAAPVEAPRPVSERIEAILLEQRPFVTPDVSGRRPRIVHYTGSLNAGGAERQMCNLAVASIAAGYDVRVMCSMNLVGECAHYRPLLDRAGIEATTPGARLHPKFEPALERFPEVRELLPQFPELLMPAIDVFGELVADPPDIIHAWLDHTNLWGGVAALLADVPVVILSTRNVNPSNLPYLHHPDMHGYYAMLASSPRVRLINNSHAGAKDYADWLGLPVERFHVIHNGLDLETIQPPTPAQITAFREELGLQSTDRLMAGVFRFSAEKDPLAFIEAARRVMALVPMLHTVIAGSGMMADEVRRAVKRSGWANRFHLLGRRDDVPVILGASELLLLASRFEGTPNVLLEAQHLGCAVVSTRAGGAVDAVADGTSGILCDIDDVDELVSVVAGLLCDPPRLAELGSKGPAFVADRFNLEQMVAKHFKIYRDALGDGSSSHEGVPVVHTTSLGAPVQS